MKLNKKNINILAIETSCDDTSVAVVRNGREILSNVVSSQIDLHRKFGGVVPELASRNHIENIDFVIKEALRLSKLENFDNIDAVGVTYGPGLVGSLIVGVSYAKAISYAKNIPLIGIHHINGHICANYIENSDWKPPFVCLVVSGGHTNLVLVKDYGRFKILGQTRDDACGETFDKVARTLGLPYPGGPEIDKLAQNGNETAIDFPQVMLNSNDYDFSFSGLKSAVLSYLNSKKMKNEEVNKNDLAASFQKAAIEVLIKKAVKACKNENVLKLSIAGGVSANSYLRKRLNEICLKEEIKLNTPSLFLCTDNAAMIGSAAYFEYLKGNFCDLYLNAHPNLKLDENI